MRFVNRFRIPAVNLSPRQQMEYPPLNHSEVSQVLVEALCALREGASDYSSSRHTDWQIRCFQ